MIVWCISSGLVRVFLFDCSFMAKYLETRCEINSYQSFVMRTYINGFF